MTATPRPSKSEIRRLIAATNAPEAAPEPLADELTAYLDTYRPKRHLVSDEDWAAVEPFVVDVIRRDRPSTVESLRQRLVALTAYALWARDLGYPLKREDLFDFQRIDAFAAAYPASTTTRANYRSRLRGITHNVNPAGTGINAGFPGSHQAVKPPYVPQEVAQIVRIARTQPTETIRRQTCACVGLGLGCGLDATDLRQLRRRHIEDLGEDGIRIEVPGQRPRTVWVRIEYEELVRIGLAGIQPDDLVIGEKVDRRNVTCGIFNRAEIVGDAPNVEQSRLRTTWLATLLTARLPLPVIMDAAGLKGARTLTDLLAFIPTDGDAAQTRGVR